MKKKMLTPIAAMAVAAFTMVGCASSNDGMSDTTAMDGTTMSETETMAGNTETDATTTTDMGTTGTVGTEMSADMAAYADMFNDLGNTEQHDIMAIAKSNPKLSTFVSLAEMAGMGAALNNAGTDFTVFIPTNEAFESLPKEEYDRLTNPANKADLIKVLQAHVLPDNVMTNQFQDNQRIETTDGKVINIGVTGEVGANQTVTIGGATVVKPNVKASNGTVHIVNSVIMPTDNVGGAR